MAWSVGEGVCIGLWARTEVWSVDEPFRLVVCPLACLRVLWRGVSLTITIALARLCQGKCLMHILPLGVVLSWSTLCRHLTLLKGIETFSQLFDITVPASAMRLAHVSNHAVLCCVDMHTLCLVLSSWAVC